MCCSIVLLKIPMLFFFSSQLTSPAGKGRVVAEKRAILSSFKTPFPRSLNALYISVQFWILQWPDVYLLQTFHCGIYSLDTYMTILEPSDEHKFSMILSVYVCSRTCKLSLWFRYWRVSDPWFIALDQVARFVFEKAIRTYFCNRNFLWELFPRQFYLGLR
jgi:hypothetical protein